MEDPDRRKDPLRRGPERISNVKVTEMSVKEAEALLLKHKPDLTPDIREQKNQAAWSSSDWAARSGADFRKRSKRAFLLEWEGGSSPDGAVVGKDTITSIQGGRVSFANHSNTAAIYERIARGGGERHEIQKIIVFLY